MDKEKEDRYCFCRNCGKEFLVRDDDLDSDPDEDELCDDCLINSAP